MEVLVAVRVEVRVPVEVFIPGPVTVGVGSEEVVAVGEALPTALPVGVEVAVVTSRNSTVSTRVTVACVTLTNLV